MSVHEGRVFCGEPSGVATGGDWGGRVPPPHLSQGPIVGFVQIR